MASRKGVFNMVEPTNMSGEGSSAAKPTVPVTGGCLCGAVRYVSAAPPIAGYYCHCTMCQKSYGGLFQATLRFAGATFAFSTAEPHYYRSSAFARRGFCAQCGSPIVFVYDGNQDVWVLLGSLDHPEDWPLTKDADWGRTEHVGIESKVPWYQIKDGLRQKTSEAIVSRAAAMEHSAGNQ
jgi:hypothetical protein